MKALPTGRERSVGQRTDRVTSGSQYARHGAHGAHRLLCGAMARMGTSMSTHNSDEPAWARDYPPAPRLKPPTILESLAQGFEGAEFYLQDDRPIAVWLGRDIGVDYSQYPTREVDASESISSRAKITEWQFRTLVCALHGIVKSSRT
jgi:hypothetical protein